MTYYEVNPESRPACVSGHSFFYARAVRWRCVSGRVERPAVDCVLRVSPLPSRLPDALSTRLTLCCCLNRRRRHVDLHTDQPDPPDKRGRGAGPPGRKALRDRLLPEQSHGLAERSVSGAGRGGARD